MPKVIWIGGLLAGVAAAVVWMYPRPVTSFIGGMTVATRPLPPEAMAIQAACSVSADASADAEYRKVIEGLENQESWLDLVENAKREQSAPGEQSQIAHAELPPLDAITIPSADSASAVEEPAEEAAPVASAIPPTPTTETRPPEFMPYIEDENACSWIKDVLCDFWSQVKSRIISTIQEMNTGSLQFGVGVNSNSGLAGGVILNERNFDVSQSKPAAGCCPSAATKIDAAEESEMSLEEHVKSLLKKNSPAGKAQRGIDTMEFRPSDAKRGEFDPKPL